MTVKIQKFGEGLKTRTQQEYLSGEWIDVDTVEVDLSLLTASKVAVNNLDAFSGKPGQILMINEFNEPEWTDSMVLKDKALREEYPGLKIAWDNVMEALQEYEMVKKLVKDYDKK